MAVILHRGRIAGEGDPFLRSVLRGVGGVAGDRFRGGRSPAGEVVAFVGGYGGGGGGVGAVCKVFGYDVAAGVLVFQGAVVALIIGNGVPVLLPDGVEVVAIAADAGGGACAEDGGGGVWGRRPTLEGVARPLRQVVYLVIVEDGDLLVVSHLIDLIGRIVVAFEVRVVGYGVLLGGDDVVCGEGDVRHPDCKALAGVVDVALFIRPVGKFHAFRGVEAVLRESAHFRLCLVNVFIAVFERIALAQAGGVGHRVGHAAIDGEDLGIGAQRLVDIDAIALRIHPAEEVKGVVAFDIRHRPLIRIRTGDGVAHGDLGGDGILPFDLHVDGDGHGILLPVGVEDQVARGHLFAFEVKRLRILRDIVRLNRIPTNEPGVYAEAFGARRHIACIVRQRRLIVNRLFFYRIAIVDEGQVIRVAEVVEVEAVVAIKIFLVIPEARLTATEPRKALNLVILLFVGRIVEVGVYRLEEFIIIIGLIRPGIACIDADLLHIIVDGLKPVGALRIEFEGDIRPRHAIQGLEGIVIGTAGILPSAAIVGGIERGFLKLIRDVCAVLGGDGGYGLPIRPPNTSTICPERQRILIAGEVDVQHGGTVGVDGDVHIARVIRIVGEMLPVRRPLRQFNKIAGGNYGTGLRGVAFNRVKRGVAFVIRVLAPVDDGVSHLIAFPDGVERGRCGRREVCVVGNARAIRLIAPVLERIAGAGGAIIVQVDGLTVRDIRGIHRRAALGIKGDPVAFRRFGGDVGVARHGGLRRKGSLRVLHDPTGDGKIAIRHIVRRRGDLVALVLRGLQGAIDIAVRREEEDIVDVGEPGVHAHVGIFRKVGDGRGEVQLRAVNIPALELLAIRHRGRGGFGDRFAHGDDLRIYHFFSIIEGVGGKILAIVRLDNVQRRDLRRRNAGACVAGIDQGERIDGEHTHEHEHREQHRREFSHFPKHERPLLQHVTGWVKLSARAQARHLQREKRRATRPARKFGGRGACPYRRRGRVSPPGR